MTFSLPTTELAETKMLLHEIVNVVQNGWTIDYFWQVGAFVLAIFLGLLLSRKANDSLARLNPPVDSEGFFDRVKRYFVDISSHLTFSLISASILWFLVWIMRSAAIISDHKTLVLAQLGYSVLYAFALLRILLSVLRWMTGEKVITPAVTRLVTWVFWGLVFLEFAGILPRIEQMMKAQSIPVGTQNLTVWTIFSGIVSVALTLGVANWLANILEGAFRRSRGLAPNLRLVFSRLSRWCLMILAVLIAMSSVGIDLTVLSVFGGAFGVGLGFGLQKIASNYVSGFIILMERSIRIGDYVEIAGNKGKVSEINTRYTVLCDTRGVETLVPNENFVTGTVRNFYHSDNACIASICISVAYGCDVNRAIAILREEANRPARVLKNRQGWCGITELDDSGINLEAGVWIPNVGDGILGLRTEVLLKVLERYEQEGIEVPYPQLDLRIREDGGLPASLEKIAAQLALRQEQASSKPA